MLQLCLPVNNILIPILITDKKSHELGNNGNPMSKKLKFSCFFFLLLFMFQQKTLEKWEKNNPS